MPNAYKVQCDVCEHGSRDEIDSRLSRNIPLAIVAQEFRINQISLEWHLDRHLRIARVIPNDPQRLLMDLDFAKQRTEEIAIWAMSNDKHGVALAALREFRENVSEIAKLTKAAQALDPKNFIPFFEEIKKRLMEVVEKHPELRDSIVSALAIEDKGA